MLHSNAILRDKRFGDIIKHLFDHFDNAINNDLEKEKMQLHPYIYRTFKTFIQHKTEISMDIVHVQKYVEDETLLELLFDDLGSDCTDTSNPWTATGVHHNLIKSRLFHILNNAVHVYINVYDDSFRSYGGYYPFSLPEFLARIKNTSIIKAVISFKGAYRAGICASLKSSSEFQIMQNRDKDQQFEIQITMDIDGEKDIITINKHK